MQTRDSFLATGLVPCIPREDEEDCVICGEPYTDPVKLRPCGHVFDGVCVQKWLMMKSRNTCPLCKIELFTIPKNEDLQVGQPRHELAVVALRNSGLNNTETLTSIEKFGCSPPSIPALQRATAHATGFLASAPQTNDARGLSGPAVIRTQSLFASFIAMGNLIPAMAAAQGRPYGRRDSADWKLVVCQLASILAREDGKKFDAMVMAAKLRKELRKQLNGLYSDANYITFMFVYSDPLRPNEPYEDLQALLDYLTLCCWKIQRQEEIDARRLQGQKERARQERKAGKKGGCAVM
jgi:hypothetical protein